MAIYSYYRSKYSPKLSNTKYYFLYKTTNLVNGRKYIGVHSTKNLDDFYLGSSKILKTAIKKYGIDNFKREILEYFSNEKDMYEREKEIIITLLFLG